MKKIGFIIIALFYCIGIFPQNVVVLESANTTGGTITACERIELKPGFSFTASQGKSLTLQISNSDCTQSESVAAKNDKNYILSVTPLDATKNVQIAGGQVTIGSDIRALIKVQYFDGLGQAWQTVQKGITPDKKDLVSLISHGTKGDELYKWLPVPVTSKAGLPDQGSIMQQAKVYYADNNPYQTKETILGDFGTIRSYITPPGADWYNNNKLKMIRYTGNWELDFQPPYLLHRVSKYKALANGVQNMGLYANNSLEYILIKDEDDKETMRFYDERGKLILERKVYDESNDIFYDTYYVYDDLDNLCFVLSPEASALMSKTTGAYSASSVNTTEIDQYAFAYRYDEKRRCISSKNPGVDWVHYVYDKAGRIILTQDGNQRASNIWSFIKYDRYGRIIQKGTTVTTKTHAALQSDYTNIVFTEEWKPQGYTNNNQIPGTGIAILETNYYDTYEFLNLPTYSAIKSILTYSTITGFDSKSTPRTNSSGVDISARGLLTGSSRSLLEESGEIVTAMYYDNKGRLVQSLSNNHRVGYEKYYYSLSFTGSPNKYRHVHKAFSGAELTENYTYEYDHAGRLTATKYTINNLPALKMNAFEYDDLGRVKKKKFNNDAHAISYTYNLHSQLKSISSDFFSQTLRYQDATAQKYYNGNISEMDETTLSFNKLYHTYQYDGVNRLQSAKTGLTANGNDFSSQYGYDKNSNITSLNRKGFLHNMIGNTITNDYIDQLQIQYVGNRLYKINDYAENTPGMITSGDNDFKENKSCSTEYLYDNNGNLIADCNKNIAWIKYNSLNLQNKFQMVNGDKIEYMYDAAGVKRKSTYSLVLNSMQIPLGNTGMENTTNIGMVVTRDYCNNVVYRNGSLERIYTPEGYVLASNANSSFWQYVYQIKDYQGNVRSEAISDSICNNTGIRSCRNRYSTAYYPYGMEMVSQSGQYVPNPAPPNLFSGNEMERTDIQLYDFFARRYDQQLGRFLTIDPLAALNYSVSPYVYCDGDPINYIDILGLQKDGENYFGSGTGTPENPVEIPEVIVTPNWAYLGDRGDNDDSNPFSNYSYSNQSEYEKVKALEELMKNQGIAYGDKSNFRFYNRPYDPPLEDVHPEFYLFLIGKGLLDLFTETVIDEETVLVGQAATEGEEQTFEIADGVRRAKAAQQLGHTTIEAMDNTGKTFQVAIKDLYSPFKNSIDVSTPLNQFRYDIIYNGLKAGGDILPPIYVNAGSRGVSIFDIYFIH